MSAQALKLDNFKLAHKLAAAVLIFILPIFLMGYFLVVEKDVLISFTQQEIAGVEYLRAAQAALHAVTATNPSASDFESAIDKIKQAEKADAGNLGLSDKASAAASALSDAKNGKTADAIGKVGDLISAISDNSNITLDPDSDTYFIGDILVNQASGILTHTAELVAAAHALEADAKNEYNIIAFAEARDNLAGSAGNFSNDLGKALRTNLDGTAKPALEAAGTAVTAAADKIASIVKSDNRGQLVSTADELFRAVAAFTAKGNDEIVHLLNVRNDGFRSTIMSRLGIAMICVLVGALISWIVVVSVTKPLNQVIGLMGQLTDGRLDIEVPKVERGDEIGRLFIALNAFYDSSVEREKIRQSEHKRQEAERRRVIVIGELNESFKSSVRVSISELNNAVGLMNQSATLMAKDAEEATKQTTTVAAAAEEASVNVQTVASASEELSASIREISSQVSSSTAIAKQAVDEAKQTRAMVGTLSEATGKISEVVGLINQIAGQTNLLALNATIEAARAGEAGKGFAVVASEVKTLANQTAKATEDITSHIGAIQEAVRNVSTAIEHIDHIITKINETTTSISSAVEEQGAATQEIARNVQEAAKGTADVTTAISRIANIISSSDRISREVLESSNSLATETTKLDNGVGIYLTNIENA